MKNTTVLWVSNLLYRIKDNTRIFFLITITSAVAFSSIGSVYAYWRDKEGQINRNFPQAFFLANRDNDKKRADFIEASLKEKGIDYTKVKGEMKFVIPKEDREEEVVIIKEIFYRGLASMLSADTISFDNNEAIIAASLVEEEHYLEFILLIG
jgi:putative ABC transport system permease protein